MQVQPYAGGGKIVWGAEDWVSGLAPNYTTSTTGFQKGVKQLVAARAMNPFRSYGNAYPGYLPTDATNVSEVSDICLKGLVQGTSAFIVTLGDKLQKLTLTSDTLAASWQLISTTGHGGHSGVVGSDCALYTAKVGGVSQQRWFYSWYDSTDWDVGTFDLTATFDSDFMSTAPATPLDLSSGYEAGTGFPHPLIVGDDDILYIGDRNFVHAYDGQNAADNDGKFFPQVLTLPGGYIISSFAKTANGLMIFATRTNSQGLGSSATYRGSSKAYLWDYLSLDFTYAYELNDNLVSESFAYKGTVGCFTQGGSKDPASSTKLSKIQLWNGSIFETVQTFIGNLPVRGGVEVNEDVIYFNADGIIHAYGSPLWGVATGLNKITEGGGTTSGMLSTFQTNFQYICTGTTTAGGLQVINLVHSASPYLSTAQLATPLVEPAFPDGQHGRVKSVKINYVTTTTSASSRGLSVLLNPKGSNVTITSGITSVASGATSATYYLDTSGNALPVFESLKLILQWDAGNGTTDAPGIETVECVYENVNV